jgi:hypothetical protein
MYYLCVLLILKQYNIMGQYFSPKNVDLKESLNSHDYGSGLKLMEHSWVKNPFVNVVEKLIAEGGKWFGHRIVWAGDYADPEVDENDNVITEMYDGKPRERNLYDIIDNDIKVEQTKFKMYRYVINETKKQFVDKTKIPDNDGWRIHPLPLLTCEGNNRGSGDYRYDDNNNVIGSWSRDVVTVSTRKPKKEYTEIVFDLVER